MKFRFIAFGVAFLCLAAAAIYLLTSSQSPREHDPDNLPPAAAPLSGGGQECGTDQNPEDSAPREFDARSAKDDATRKTAEAHRKLPATPQHASVATNTKLPPDLAADAGGERPFQQKSPQATLPNKLLLPVAQTRLIKRDKSRLHKSDLVMLDFINEQRSMASLDELPTLPTGLNDEECLMLLNGLRRKRGEPPLNTMPTGGGSRQ